MAKFVYNGEVELTFPTLGLTVNKGDVFEAPADVANNVIVLSTSKAAPVVADPAPTDPTI